jgi:hypothetical protein
MNWQEVITPCETIRVNKRERAREEKAVGGSERLSIGGAFFFSSGVEGFHAVPACPSGRSMFDRG